MAFNFQIIYALPDIIRILNFTFSVYMTPRHESDINTG
uniref:Uncharacterized protein n=1 Tax=Klebsiella pneumoniae TaxID=573 RepID=A0A482M5Q9_KLEPN|nr:hypothetical protein [Klebsiella pneumoniae]QUW40605.1 hypothetical protein [Raoultella ornithinolytica]